MERWGSSSGHLAASARALALAALAAAAIALTAPAPADAASEGGPLTRSCRAASETLRGPCRGAEQLVAAGSATCRWAGVPDQACTTPLGPRVSDAAVDRYENSWTHRALRLQFDLASDVPFRNAPWIGTHNSYNSTAEMGPTLSDTDANQQLSLVDQLRLDVRSLEIDVHRFPSVHTGKQSAVVCHALGNHGGCSIEKPLRPVLSEIAGWLRLPENSDQVLLLYVEDHLDNRAGYDDAARALRVRLGDLLYLPPGGGCTELPLDLTRDAILAAGHQVVVFTDSCGKGPGWPGATFTLEERVQTRVVGFSDFPKCGKDFDRPTYQSTVVRYWEDSTGVTAGAATLGASSHDDGLTPRTVRWMARCGVDLTGLDQILPDDGRLTSFVWSWAPFQPAAGGCAVQRVDADFPKGRWFSRDCAEFRPAACRAADGSWLVTPVAVTQADAEAACAALGATHAVPRTGFEDQLLRVAMEDAGVGEAWLGYTLQAGEWVPADTL